MKVRQDAWTEEDDLLLAETVLRHVREGSTQLNAFEEVGDKLNRTSAACGFRWNAVVRHSYDKALALAKKQRKQRKRVLGNDQSAKKRLLYTPPVPTIEDIGLNQQAVEGSETSIPLGQGEEAPVRIAAPPAVEKVAASNPVPAGQTLSMDVIIDYLQSINHSVLQLEVLRSENERLKLELAEEKKHSRELEHKINHLEQDTGLIQEDYETLMKIMNRARKLVLLDEDDRPATKFKMDRNGNLEKVAE